MTPAQKHAYELAALLPAALEVWETAIQKKHEEEGIVSLFGDIHAPKFDADDETIYFTATCFDVRLTMPVRYAFPFAKPEDMLQQLISDFTHLAWARAQVLKASPLLFREDEPLNYRARIAIAVLYQEVLHHGLSRTDFDALASVSTAAVYQGPRNLETSLRPDRQAELHDLLANIDTDVMELIEDHR